VTVFGLAACLRPAITAVGPLFPEIGEDTGLSSSALGILGSLPLLLFAAVAPLAGFAVRRLGIDAVALGVTVGLIAGITTRSVAGMGGLWAGTAVIGAAAAVGNVLIPVLLRRDYPSSTAMASGVSAMMLGGFAALGSGLTVVFAGWTGGWRQPLLLWAALPALIGAFWLIRRAAGSRMRGARTHGRGHHRARLSPRSPTAWAITGFMGMQSLCFYLIVNWFPSIEMGRGVSAGHAGLHLLIFQLVGAPFSLVTSWFLQRSGRYLTTAILVSALTAVAALGLLLTDRWPLVWIVVAAPGSGGALAVALLLMANRAVSVADAAGLSVMANTGGYLLAACAPVAVGLFHQWWSSWTPALGLLLTAAAIQTALCLPAVLGRPVGSTPRAA
jgi:CP family cyanate transporter-like MFS transporter